MSENKMRIKAIRDYFMKCPHLKDGCLNIDYLNPDEKIQYSINPTVTSNPIVKSYVDGSTLRQYLFNFSSSEIRSPDVIDQIEASNFYENLQEWIEENNSKNILPEYEGIQSIEVLAPGYMFNADYKSAIYQIQCRITYMKEAY